MKRQIIYMPPESIKPYANNPRKNDAAVEKVVKSISAYGFNSPIVVDKDMTIINGHTRHKAALRLGMREVPVIVAGDLDEAKVKAYRIMDNRSGEVATWDEELLLKEILELLEHQNDLPLEFTGYDKDELSKELGLNLDRVEVKGKKKKKAADDEIEGEMDFAQELLEEHQYVVLYFDNTLDWQVAKQFFGLRSVRRNRTEMARDRKALGRVVSGKDFLEKVREAGLIE